VFERVRWRMIGPGEDVRCEMPREKRLITGMHDEDIVGQLHRYG